MEWIELNCVTSFFFFCFPFFRYLFVFLHILNISRCLCGVAVIILIDTYLCMKVIGSKSTEAMGKVLAWEQKRGVNDDVAWKEARDLGKFLICKNANLIIVVALGFGIASALSEGRDCVCLTIIYRQQKAKGYFKISTHCNYLCNKTSVHVRVAAAWFFFFFTIPMHIMNISLSL